jgi:hypothetical protein
VPSSVFLDVVDTQESSVGDHNGENVVGGLDIEFTSEGSPGNNPPTNIADNETEQNTVS